MLTFDDLLKRYNPNQPRHGKGKGKESGRWKKEGDAYNNVSGVWTGPNGKRVSDEVRERIRALRIPPGWRDVRINPTGKGSMLAVGIDSKGRRVSKPNPEFAAGRAKIKFERVQRLGKARPTILASAAAAADTDDAAATTLLIAKTGMRIGSMRDTKAAVQAYGATTLLREHVKVKGDAIMFTFTGKKGVAIGLAVNDAELASIMKGRVKRAKTGERLFKTNERRVNDFIKANGGAGFTAKDFRTWLATSVALREAKKLQPAATMAAFKKERKRIATLVSSMLGNTPAMALSSYIDPTVWHNIHPLRSK